MSNRLFSTWVHSPKLFFPREHSPRKVPGILEPHCIEHQAGLAAAISASAITDQFFIFKIIQLFNAHGFDLTQWNKESAYIKICILVRFANIHKFHLFT